MKSKSPQMAFLLGGENFGKRMREKKTKPPHQMAFLLKGGVGENFSFGTKEKFSPTSKRKHYFRLSRALPIRSMPLMIEASSRANERRR